MAELLIDRLADLRAAESMADLPLGGTGELATDVVNFAISVSVNLRIIAAPNHDRRVWPTSGNVSGKQIWRIKILKLEWTSDD